MKTVGEFRFMVIALREIYPRWTHQDLLKAKALHYDMERFEMNEAASMSEEDEAFCEAQILHLTQAIDLMEDRIDKGQQERNVQFARIDAEVAAMNPLELRESLDREIQHPGFDMNTNKR